MSNQLFNNLTVPLVTLTGECFDIEFADTQRVPPDNVLYLFYVTDKTKARGLRKVSVERFGPKEWLAKDYDARVEGVVLNVIRRAFDSGELSFDIPDDPVYFEKIPMSDSDFKPQSQSSDPEIRQFVIHTAFWISYRFGNRYPVQFDTPIDLQYLGVEAQDIRRNVWLLEEDGLLEKSNIPGMGRPRSALVKAYEAKQSTIVGNELMFPKGTQYEAFKEIKKILRSATREIIVVDNYLDESVLDMLESLTARPSLKLLTSKAAADFKVAVRKFSSQYQQTIEIKLHQKQVHDRAIAIDDTHFYVLGASIKDAGGQLFFINKIEDPTNIARLRAEFQTIWASAAPL